MKVITCCRSVTSSLDRPVQASVDEDMSSPLGKAVVRELPWDVKAPPINNDLSNGLLYDDISDDEEMFLRFSGGEDDDEETRVAVDGKAAPRSDIGPARDVKVCVDGQDDAKRTECSDNDIKGHTSVERNMLCDDSRSDDVKVSSRSDDSNTHIPDKNAGLETMVAKTFESGLADDDFHSTLCHVDTEGVTNKHVKSRTAVNIPRLAEFSTSGEPRNIEQCHNLSEICVQKKENISKSYEESGCEMTIFDGPNKESCALGTHIDHAILEVHPTDKMILYDVKEGNIEANQDKAKSAEEDGVKVENEKCLSNFPNVEKTKGPMETKCEGCIPPSRTAGPLEGETFNQRETQMLEETSEHALTEPMETDKVELPSYGDKYIDRGLLGIGAANRNSTDWNNTHKESEANINIELSSPAVPCENQINLDGQSPFTILSGDCHTEESKTKVLCKIQVSGSESDDSKQVKKETVDVDASYEKRQGDEENMTEIILISSEKIVLGNEGEVTKSLGIEACLERTEANPLIKRLVQNNENGENIEVLGNNSVEFPNKNKLCDRECERLNDCEELLKNTQTDVFCEPRGFEDKNESEIKKEIPFLNNIFDKVEVTKQIDANAPNDNGSPLEHEADLTTKAQLSGQSDPLPLNCTDGTLQQKESMPSWKGVECEGAKHEERDLDNIRTPKVLSSECHHNNKDEGNVVNIKMVENINRLEVESKSNLVREAVSCQVDASVPRPEEAIFAHGGGEEELGGLSRGAALDLKEENLSRKRCSPTTKVVSDPKRLKLEDEDLCRVENHPEVEEREHVHEVELGIPLPKRRKTTEDDFIMVFKEETCPDSQVQEETACKNNAPTPSARDIETLSGTGLDKCFALDGEKQSSLVDDEQVVTLGMFLVDKEQSVTALDNEKYMTTLDKGESLFEESNRPSLPVVDEGEGISFVDKEDILPALDKNKCITDSEEGLSTVSYKKCLPLVNKKESLLILNEVEGLPLGGHTEESLPVADKEESLLVLHKEESYPVVNKKGSLLVVMNKKERLVLNQEENLFAVDKEVSLAVVDKEERLVLADKEESLPIADNEESLSVGNKEESLPVVNKEESLPIVNKEESLPVVNKEESLPVVNKEESLPIVNKEESLPVVNKEESLPVLNKEESLPVVNKEESLPVVNKEESLPVLNKEGILPIVNKEGILPIVNKEESLLVLDQVKSLPIVNKEESLPVVHKEESLPVVHKEESLPVVNKEESLLVLDQVKSLPIVNKVESLPVVNKEESLLVSYKEESLLVLDQVKSLPVVDKEESLPILNKEESLPVVNKEESLLVLDQVKSLPVVDKEESLPILNKEESLPVVNKEESLLVLDKEESLPVVDKEESLPVVNKEESLPVVHKEESLLVLDQVKSLLFGGKEEILHVVEEGESRSFGNKEENLPAIGKEENLLASREQSLPVLNKGESWPTIEKSFLVADKKESLLVVGKEESLLVSNDYHSQPTSKENLSSGGAGEMLPVCNEDILLATYKEDNSNGAVNEVLDTTMRVKEDILSILKQDKLPSTDKHECLPSVEEDILLSESNDANICDAVVDASIPAVIKEGTIFDVDKDQTISAVDKASLLVVDNASLPAIDKGGSIPAIDKESLPAVDKASIPAIDKESLPAVDKSSISAVDKESLPAVDKSSISAVDKESLPAVDKECLPTVDKESLPTVDKESLLGADKESLLGTDKESLLGAHKESLPAIDKESLLGADKESLLCTDKESLLGADKENLPALSQVEAGVNSTLTASEANEDSLHAMLRDEDSLLASDEEDTITTRNTFALKVKGSIFGKIKESEVKPTRGEFSSDEDSFGGFPEELLLSADDLSDKDESTSFSTDKNESMSLLANKIESPVSVDKGKINPALKGKEENLLGDADDTLSATEGKNETGLSSDDCSSKSTERPLDGDKRPATKGPSKGKDSGLLGKRRLESLRPEIIKVKKVRISPEVEKQLKNQAEKDALRKKEPAHSLPAKTPITNLDFAIERVVSKAAVAAPGISDEERSIIMSYMKAFHKVTMSKMTRDDLEEMVMQKMCELIAHRSELGQNRQKIQSLELLNDQLRRKSLQLQKQAKDLHTVTQRLVNELRTRKDGKMTPVRLTRSVGLQVQVQTQPMPTYRGPGPELGPHGFISGGRVRKPPPITTSPPSAPPTIPISVSTPLTSSAQLARKLAVPPQSRVLPTTPTAGTTTTFVTATRVSVIAPPVPPSVKVSQPPIKTTSRPSVSSGGPPTVRVQPMMLQNPPRLSPIKPPKDTSFIDLTDEEDKGRPSSASVRLVGSLPSSATVTSSSPLGGSIRVVQPHQLTGTTATLLTSPASGVGGQRLAYLLPTSSSAPGQSRQVYITSSTPSSLASAATVTQVRPTSNMVAVSRSNPLPTTLMFKGGAVIPVQQGAGSPASSAAILRAAGPTVQMAASPLQTALGRPSNPSIRVSSLGAVMNKFHPAPLPAAPPYQPSNNLWKLAPPKPDLKISRVTNNKPQPGIVLSWNMQTNEQYEEIASYQLYAYQETSAHPNTNLWKKVGDVKALPLPMACTLTQFMEGHKYHFAVRAVDIHTRVGPFSIPGNIVLTKK